VSDGPIGRAVPRANARRLAAGRGRYADDLVLPRMVHLAFVRSPHAHARIGRIDAAAAARAPGVVRVITGADLARVCKPWSGTAAHIPSLKSPPQHAMAVDRATWQGEPVAAVVAASRAQAEDAAELVAIDWEELSAVADPLAALAADAPLVHPELGTNLAFEAAIRSGNAEAAFAASDVVLAEEFAFARQTGVPLEGRVVIADFEPAERRLTVYQSHQSPWQQQDLYAALLGLEEHRVRVVVPDVGGAFGIKLHAYGDEVAVAAASLLLGRPVKYAVDRLEAFAADVHAREERVSARIGLAKDGTIRAMAVDAVLAFGAYNAHRRPSQGEGMMTIGFAGAPYGFRDYEGRLRCVFQHKNTLGVYRGVGQPIACAVSEQLIDHAAAAAGIDPLEMRRRNFHRIDAYPLTTPGMIAIERLSLQACLEKLVGLMGYPRLRAEQRRLRQRGILRGIGVATFVEVTAVGPYYYGPSESRVSTQDGCTVRLEPTGKVRCVTSATDQGQGTWTGITQIVAERLGVEPSDVDIVAHDTAVTSYGSGAWASRGLTVAGEAAWLAADALRENVLKLAGAILQARPASLALAGGEVRDAATGRARIRLAELAHVGHFRHDVLPKDVQPELAATRAYYPKDRPYAVANGIQASWLEVDRDTGMVRLLDHWIVEDCGRVVNPLLVDEQLRGGVVQGIGSALYEECAYDAHGQLQNGTLADYLVPMATEMPDIHVSHVEVPLAGTAIGTKGAGEGGAVGAPAAILLAVNDALRPLGARVAQLPITPERVLAAIGAANT
jgi:carbon-monoxide dehydrogenase large subunit